ncbi:MAG: hypothetical protein OEZ38_07440 [Gammaproteobacteria bacterium]|nr:hypothetical protein [Gammaproteobacteria bacterium]
MLSTSLQANQSSEFNQWLKQEKESFQEYKDKRDKEFTQFLKTQWLEMQTMQGLVRDKIPKPYVMPVAAPEPVKLPDKPVPKIVPDTRPEQIPSQEKIPDEPVRPEAVKPVKVTLPEGKRVQIMFYGHDIQVSYDQKLKTQLKGRINQNTISQFWSDLSRANYDFLIEQLQNLHNEMGLNDWAYIQLINQVAKSIYPHQQNEQVLLSWFALVKESYQVRIAYDTGQVYLLMPSMQSLYAAPYFTFDGVRYYAISLGGENQQPGNVHTYNGQYPGANKVIDMRLRGTIKTARKDVKKKLKFNYKNTSYEVDAEYDQNIVQFLNTYPQMDIAMYYVAKVDYSTGQQLLKELRPLVKGKSELEAVNLLLRFVQTAFTYKTDEKQFGKENYLFFEETLHYPYSDCEDRSVFFAWLVRNLLNLEVVGLDYPGHIAAAVAFKQSVKGDSVMVKGKRFVVTDPTYINAGAGATMPGYRGKSPKIIHTGF